jgi:hypothetical protein
VIDPKQFNLIAQFSHFFSSAFVVLAAGHLWGTHAATIAAGIVVGYAAVKEFYFDRSQAPDVRGSSLEDFLVQLAGVGAGLGLMAVIMSGEKKPARLLEFKQPEKPLPQIPRCVCEHTQDAHVAWSGECRPGFVCLARCQIFKAKGPA